MACISPSARSGFFISIEGIDGAGKSTHIDAMATALRAAGHCVELTREPGGTPLGEHLRELVLTQPMSAMTEALLVFAARAEHVRSRIAPALARGAVVISDRFADASFAYQGAGRGVNMQHLHELEAMSLQLCDGGARIEPDLTLWFDLDAATAAARLAHARVPDRFERQPQDFFHAVRTGYAQRCAAHPARFVRINAAQSPEQVRHDVLAALAARGLISAPVVTPIAAQP